MLNASITPAKDPINYNHVVTSLYSQAHIVLITTITKVINLLALLLGVFTSKAWNVFSLIGNKLTA
jgi:hypothetical protein